MKGFDGNQQTRTKHGEERNSSQPREKLDMGDIEARRLSRRNPSDYVDFEEV